MSDSDKTKAQAKKDELQAKRIPKLKEEAQISEIEQAELEKQKQFREAKELIEQEKQDRVNQCNMMIAQALQQTRCEIKMEGVKSVTLDNGETIPTRINIKALD